MRTVYLDNNATTMVAPEVVEEMIPYFSEQYGNPSSIHSFGGQVKEKVEEARKSVADLIGADNDYEITFTGTGTESDNIAILGTTTYYKEKKHVITTKVEHPAILTTYKKLERDGYDVTYIPVDKEGTLDLQLLKNAVRDDTVLVSVMHANNETGVLNPVEEIGEFLKDKDVVFHIDAVQSVGKISVDVNKIGCDLLTMSGHKIHAPKGLGVLYVRKGTRLRPISFGGHQERGRRPGTENVPGIIAFGKACELAKAGLKDMDRVAALRDKLEAGILSAFKNTHLNGKVGNRVPNTTNIGFEYIEGESILLYLYEHGICSSSGSACSSGSLEPSHVLRAMDVPFISSHGSIRFSLSRYTTEEEIDYTLSKLPAVVNRLLEISPFWDNEKQEGKEMTWQ